MTKQKRVKIYQIKLSGRNNEIAIVDQDQKNRVKKYSWNAKYVRNTDICYAYTEVNCRTFRLHNFIMDHTPTKEYTVDHINRNTLDNRKSNLRIVNNSVQSINRASPNTKTGVIGVCINKKQNCWFARWIENKKHVKKSFTYYDYKSFRNAFIKAFITRKNKEREIEDYRIALCLDSIPYSDMLISLTEPSQYFEKFMEKNPEWETKCIRK
jgi:hypothetical protein